MFPIVDCSNTICIIVWLIKCYEIGHHANNKQSKEVGIRLVKHAECAVATVPKRLGGAYGSMGGELESVEDADLGLKFILINIK